jgi:hippurate hydrolase
MLLEALPRICEGIAATHQAKAVVEIQGGYPVVMNDGGFDAFARETAAELLGERAPIVLPAPIMGAEDFAYVLHRAPGVMMLLGVRPPGEKDPAPCHSSRMRLDEDAMALGSALHATIATRYLAEP